MTIEIITQDTIEIDGSSFRAVMIAIDNGGPVYQHFVGGLPTAGDLQAILEAREAELFADAQAKGVLYESYNVVSKRAIKALALVIMDEFNILRALHLLPDRTPSQIETAIKNKLKTL